MLELTSTSYSYPLVAASVRARVARQLGSLPDAFVLATCLRVETLMLGEHPEIPDVSPARRRGEAAFAHLCRVAAGFESPVLGEPEVFAQFRAAAAARKAGGAKGELDRVLSAAVAVSRAVRRHLVDSPRGSLGKVAARLVALHQPVAILGTGLMARSAVEHLQGAELTVIGRRAGELAGHPIRPWTEAPRALATFPAVISAIPGDTASQATLADALATRDRPLLLIDLGMPPSFEVTEPPTHLNYLGVDDLAATAEPAVVPAEAEAALRRATEIAWQGLSAPSRAGRVISTIVERADQVVGEEVDRYKTKLASAGDPEPVLRQLAHTIARRILHEPISFLGRKADPERVEVLSEAFGIDDD